jgi:ferric-dicitrate binding protein FerR (iron transport regulator)
MEQYLSYTSVDFVYDDDFVNWVNNGKQHLLTDTRWRTWIEKNPDKLEEVEEARMLILTLAQESPVVASGFMRAEVWGRILGTLRDNDEPVEQPALITRWYSKLAVSIALFAVVYIFMLRKPAAAIDPRVAEVETGSSNTILVRTTRVSQTLALSDGTSIVLMPGSTLEYPRDFSNLNRDVYLAGEAYFELSDEINQPFVVKTSELTLAALGSSFNVRGYENEDDTRIQVKSGRASLSQNDGHMSGSIVLMANHQATFRHSDKSMTRSLVDDPGILVPLAQASFSFNNTPVSTVLESIGKAYGIDIAFNKVKFSACTLDADLNGMPLYGKLKTICEKTGSSYEVVDARVVMHGGSCEPDLTRTALR